MRNKLLAAVAALTLIGGAGAASAQTHGGSGGHFSGGGGFAGHAGGFTGHQGGFAGHPGSGGYYGHGDYGHTGYYGHGGYYGYRGGYWGGYPYAAGALGFALGASLAYPWYGYYDYAPDYYDYGADYYDGPPPPAAAPPPQACGQWRWNAGTNHYDWLPGACG